MKMFPDDVGMPDPSKPVPNDDPACKCELSPEIVPEGFTAVRFAAGQGNGGSVAYDPACPHHGAIVRSLSRGALGGFSIGFTQT